MDQPLLNILKNALEVLNQINPQKSSEIFDLVWSEMPDHIKLQLIGDEIIQSRDDDAKVVVNSLVEFKV